MPSPPAGLSDANPFPADCAARFRFIRRLATGGSGAVFLAEQISLNRRVAIKLLLADVLEDKEQVDRFNAEARVTAVIKHPRIVSILDFGAQRGIPWIAYELLEGQSVRDVLDRQGALPVPAALRIGIQVSEALEAMHARGILHRDIKPDNVCQVTDGEYKVTDLGLAKWTGATAIRTRTRIVLGTPAYIAPELIEDRPASPQSDIYALGIMLFELLTGSVPFGGESIPLVLQRHLTSVAPGPSTRRPGVPPEVDRAVMRALAKTPADRYVSASQMREDLERIARSLAGGEAHHASRQPDPDPRPAADRAAPTVRMLAPTAGGAQREAGGGRKTAAIFSWPMRVLIAIVVATTLTIAIPARQTPRPSGSNEAGVTGPMATPVTSVTPATPGSGTSAASDESGWKDLQPQIARTANLIGKYTAEVRSNRVKWADVDFGSKLENFGAARGDLIQAVQGFRSVVGGALEKDLRGPGWLALMPIAMGLDDATGVLSDKQRDGSVRGSLDTVAKALQRDRTPIDPYRLTFKSIFCAEQSVISNHHDESAAQKTVIAYAEALDFLGKRAPESWRSSPSGLSLLASLCSRFAVKVEHSFGVSAAAFIPEGIEEAARRLPADQQTLAAWRNCLWIGARVAAAWRTPGSHRDMGDATADVVSGLCHVLDNSAANGQDHADVLRVAHQLDQVIDPSAFTDASRHGLDKYVKAINRRCSELRLDNPFPRLTALAAQSAASTHRSSEPPSLR